MQIFYDNRKTQKLFNSGKAILKSFGAAVGKRVMQRLAELDAAQSLQMVSHLPPPRCHELVSANGHVFSVDVSENMRLLFRPSGEFSNKEDGGLDLASVKAVCIIEVKDTHEGNTRR